MLFPGWLFKGWRGETTRGRKAWPAPVLMTLLLLRWTTEGMSRRASVAMAKHNICWRAALGLALGTSVPDEKTVRDFERFLKQRHPDADVPRYLLLHEHFVRLGLQAGVVGNDAIWAMDSTPMWCFGATLDTVRLLGDGLCQLARKWSRGTRVPLTEVAEQWDLPLVLAKSTKGAFSINWRDEKARATVLNSLANTVLRIVQKIRQDVQTVRSSLRKGLLRKCRHLLRVVRDDLETDAQGRLVIAQKVTIGRMMSLTDPQARHGRKSKSARFNGFKIHLLGDVVSGMIAALSVTPASIGDARPAHRLIRRATALCGEIERVLADTAYAAAPLRYLSRGTLQVDILAPPPPVNSRSKLAFGKKDFAIDFERWSATCPNGIQSSDVLWTINTNYGIKGARFRWPKQVCQQCPLQEDCPSARGWHRILLHPYEKEVREIRERWKDQETRRLYRRRSECERLVNQMTRHGGRKARTWGLQNAQLQAYCIAMASNLGLLARALAQDDLTGTERAVQL
jgi:hypothetical protein